MNLNKNCGCEEQKPTKQMLLVEAVASDAGCGSMDPTNTVGCTKQESTYDIILSSFLLPSIGSSITISVCNGSLYSINQWVDFIGQNVKLKISSINGNLITLINSCDGYASQGNVQAGYVISEKSKFITSSKPFCDNSEEDAEKILTALSVSTELCMPNLSESSSDSKMQVVGLVIPDEGNSSVPKCIKRIFGFLMDRGTPIFSSIKISPQASVNDYRKLGVHKTTRRILEIPSFSDFVEVLAGKQYATAYKNGLEYPVGPINYECYLNIAAIEPEGNVITRVLGTSVAALQYVNIIDLYDYDEIRNLLKNYDTYYATIQLNILHAFTNGAELKLSINNEFVGWVPVNSTVFNMTVKIKIKKDTNDRDKVILKLDRIGTNILGLAIYIKLISVSV